jgi:Family of unknown function (DUF5977)
MFRLFIKSTLLALFLISTGQLCLAQQQNVIPYIQSPDAATLGSFGDFDVSAFTGIPNISVPVFSLQEGDIPVNCELRYLGGGVKPSAHPGWVGQNWELSVGGIVTRKVNGGVDEVANSQSSLPGQSGLLNQYAYLYNFGILNNPTYNPWYETQFITAYYETGMPDYTNSTTQTAGLNYQVNLAPDEFSFTLPTGVSGSFYLNQFGTWQVKTQSPAYLKVAVTTNSVTIVNNDPSQPGSLTVNRAIYTITITDESGYIYTFGNSPTAIEFSRGGRSNTYVPYNEDVVADAWYLTQIQSPTGNVVNFTYQRENNEYVQGVIYPTSENQSLSSQLGSGGSYLSQQTGVGYTAQVLNPVYLTQISSRTFNVAFNIQASTQLNYPLKNSAFVPTNSNSTYFNYSDLEISDVTSDPVAQILDIGGTQPLSVWFELNSIVVSDITNGSPGVTRDQYTFLYNNDPTQRLFLGEFRKKNLTATGADMLYHFTYDSVSLPPYNSLEQDQWGYYNGSPFPTNPAPTGASAALLTNFTMNPYYAQAGILTQIIYPTGGSTNFNWEANDYSYVLQKNGDAINLNSQTGIGGGLRIASIVNTDNTGNSLKTQYVYKKIVNGSPTVSSGVLSGYNKVYYSMNVASSTPGPTFSPLATLSFINYDDYSECLDNTDGRDVVYSEVQEILPDGSSKIFDYSNSDNPNYIDQVPTNVYSDAYVLQNSAGGVAALVQSQVYSTYSYPLLSHNSMDLERGQLLSERDYTAGGILLKQIQNTYNSDPNRFNSYVPSFDNYSIIAGNGNTLVMERYFQAVKIYTYYPYLASSAVTMYDQTGANAVTTTTNYTYDPVYKNKWTESFTASNGQPVSTTYHYTPDNSTIANLPASAQTVATAMVQAHMTGILLEKIVSRNSVQTSDERTDYGLFPGAVASFYKPALLSKSVSTLVPEPRIQYNSYDPYGHLQEEQSVNDVKHAYVWGYNNAYLVADVTGASLAAVSAALNGGNVATPASDATMRSTLNSIRTGLTGSPALVNTYTYTPLVGMTSKTDPMGKPGYFVYDGLNRLSQVMDINSNVVKLFNYNFSFQGITYPSDELIYFYHSTACNLNYTTPVPYEFDVPKGMFSSTFSQAAADQQAANYAAANGQNAANTNGICNPDILAFNTTSVGATVTLTSVTTGRVYTFIVPVGANDVIEGSLPAGTYNATCCPSASAGNYVFQISSGLVNGTGTNCTTLSNMSIVNPGDGAIYFNPQGHAQ